MARYPRSINTAPLWNSRAVPVVKIRGGDKIVGNSQGGRSAEAPEVPQTALAELGGRILSRKTKHREKRCIRTDPDRTRCSQHRYQQGAAVKALAVCWDLGIQPHPVQPYMQTLSSTRMAQDSSIYCVSYFRPMGLKKIPPLPRSIG